MGISTSVSQQESKSRIGGEQLQLVTFEVADEEFAVDILAVQEINRMMPLTRVPSSPADVEGVINLRGRIIPVVDLRTRFGLGSGTRNAQNRIVVVEVHERTIGFIVDRVNEVLRIDSSIVDPPPEMAASSRSDFIAGVGKLEDRLLILLDLGRLFSSEEVGSISSLAAA
jgi:purine-binding chemotaxis protein CheW